ncbi:MAG: glycosyltransferase family 4 protein [bacterium]
MEKKKKTLLFTLEYPPFKGGVANYYWNVVKYWKEKDNIVVLNNNHDELLNSKIFPKWLPSVFCLYQKIKKKKIKKIIVGQILPLGTAAYIVSRFTKTPYAVILHGMDFVFAGKSARKKFIRNIILKNSSEIICANHYTKDLLKKECNHEAALKAKVVNPGVESFAPYFDREKIDKIKKNYNLSNKFVIFSLGRLVKRKGFDKMIGAMPDVWENFPNTVYVIAGDGPDKEYLKAEVEKISAELRKNIFFTGKLSEEEKWLWLHICDLFAMPNRDINGDIEGFGIVFLEANIVGKPVIAGKSGGVADAVEDYENGILVNPRDKDEISGKVTELISDIVLRQALGENGMRRAVKKFNWPGQAKKIYNIINI